MSYQVPQDGDYIPGRASRERLRAAAARVYYVPGVSHGLGFGSMLAIAISYVHNESIGWAIVHGLLSWLFVIYAALFY